MGSGIVRRKVLDGLVVLRGVPGGTIRNGTKRWRRRDHILLLLDVVLAEHLDDHANLRVLVDGERVRLLVDVLERLRRCVRRCETILPSTIANQ